MLLLLSASFGYSLLSLIVNIVDRSSDERLLVQISPDGKSLLQLRKTGMAILDAQSGQVVDEVRLIGRWKNAISPADERASFWTHGNWSFRGFRRSTSVCVTSNAQIVVVRRFDDTILWWNRQTREHRVIASSSAGWLDLTLDESHDRFYVESVRSNIRAPESEALSGETEIPGLPTKFNAQCNLHVFELSTGKETKSLAT